MFNEIKKDVSDVKTIIKNKTNIPSNVTLKHDDSCCPKKKKEPKHDFTMVVREKKNSNKTINDLKKKK